MFYIINASYLLNYILSVTCFKMDTAILMLAAQNYSISSIISRHILIYTFTLCSDSNG